MKFTVNELIDFSSENLQSVFKVLFYYQQDYDFNIFQNRVKEITSLHKAKIFTLSLESVGIIAAVLLRSFAGTLGQFHGFDFVNNRFVLPEYRGNGFGSQLIEAVISYSQLRGASSIHRDIAVNNDYQLAKSLLKYGHEKIIANQLLPLSSNADLYTVKSQFHCLIVNKENTSLLAKLVDFYCDISNYDRDFVRISLLKKLESGFNYFFILIDDNSLVLSVLSVTFHIDLYQTNGFLVNEMLFKDLHTEESNLLYAKLLLNALNAKSRELQVTNIGFINTGNNPEMEKIFDKLGFDSHRGKYDAYRKVFKPVMI
jgi:GNAT superfamily N-acetyltransferase